ncbi:hypothetical protein [Serratia rubidaea]|uniref:hypothetical protein n=1 Tax=Serratia rubidaea TaxID=61652 RepID=UPI003FA3C75F
MFERRYQWDRQDLVVQQKLIENDNLTDGPQFQQRRFGYDARGQLTHSILPQREERFYYDPAVTFDGNSRHQRAEYRYDALGRRPLNQEFVNERRHMEEYSTIKSTKQMGN